MRRSPCLARQSTREFCVRARESCVWVRELVGTRVRGFGWGWGGGRARSWAPVAFRRAARPHLRRRRGCPAAPASGLATRGPARPRGRRRRRAGRSGGRRRHGRRGDAAGRRGPARRPLRGPARRPRPRRRLRRAGARRRRRRRPHRPRRARARRRHGAARAGAPAAPRGARRRPPRPSTATRRSGCACSASPGPAARPPWRTCSRRGWPQAGRTTGLVGTVGVRVAGATLPSAFTTPEAPDLQALFAVMLEEGVTDVAMEVSSHALALGRVAGTRFAVGAFTNLSQDHLDFHADMDDYFATKALAVRARSHRARGDLRRRRVGRPAGRPDPRAPTTVSTGGRGRLARRRRRGRRRRHAALHRHDPARPACRSRLRLPGPFNVANALRRPGLPGRGRGGARGGGRGPRPGSRPRPDAADRARAAVPRGRRLRPQARRRRRAARRPASAGRGPAARRARRRRATATGPSAR